MKFIFFLLFASLLTAAEQPLPNLTEISFGQTVELSVHLKKGKLNIVDFYSHYCGPCMRLLPRLHSLASASPEVNIIEVNINRPAETSGIDWKSPVARQFNLSGIPCFRIYLPEGKMLEGDQADNFTRDLLDNYPPFLDDQPACIQNMKILGEAIRLFHTQFPTREITLESLKPLLPGQIIPVCPSMGTNECYRVNAVWAQCQNHGTLYQIFQKSCGDNRRLLESALSKRKSENATGEITLSDLKQSLPGQALPVCEALSSSETYLFSTVEIRCPIHGTIRYEHYCGLFKIIKDAFADCRTEEVKAFCSEYLGLAESFGKNDWNYGNAVYEANLYLGLTALAEGDANSACEYLLKAGTTPGSPQLESYGPDLSLAKKLIKLGKTAEVKQFLDQIRQFWKSCPTLEELSKE
ncbi:MAG: thioredoxin family protein [Candidatus Wallbacteria bacterium]|nr:thioredoxin family protein [Candidatus Wallbacteria bacterium]